MLRMVNKLGPLGPAYNSFKVVHISTLTIWTRLVDNWIIIILTIDFRKNLGYFGVKLFVLNGQAIITEKMRI